MGCKVFSSNIMILLPLRSQEDPLEKEMTTHSSILVWRIPMDQGPWWATVHGVAKSQDMTERHHFHFQSLTSSALNLAVLL